jgi:uncharacterized protein (DUF2062 family)
MKAFKNFFHRLLLRQSDPFILAKTFCFGLFVAFSPYLGIQTIFAFIGSLFLGLDTKIVILVLYTVNNPWTMIPIAALDYFVGQWIVKIVGIDLTAYNPSWMNLLNHKLSPYLTKYLGSTQISLWNFLIGGNMIALIISIGLYPIIKRLFIRLKEKQTHT